MTLLTEKGTFVKETSNIDGTDQTVTLSNSSLTPKVLWLWTDDATSNATYKEAWQVSYGFSDGTNDACISGSAIDNNTTSSSAGVIRNDAVISILNGATPTTEDARADVVSFNAGNFVLNWALSDATACIIHYMVAGGTDITNVKVTQHSVSAAAGTGNEAFTGVGFQGDFINIINSCHAGGQTPAVNAIATQGPGWGVFIGAATSSSARWVLGGNSENNQPTSDVYGFKEITKIQGAYAPDLGTTIAAADFVSFGADGFTFNYTIESLSVDFPFFSLVIKGGLWNVGNGTAPASIGQQTITTTSGRDPEAVMMFTWGETVTSSGTAAEAHSRISIGGADNALREGCISTMDTDNAGTMINTTINLNSKIIRAHTAAATASSSTTLAEADIVDMDNDGNFIIDWTTTLSGMGYGWFSVSQTFVAGTNYTRSPTAEDVTISEVSLDRIKSALRLPSTEVTTVADSSLTRMLQATRVPSSDTITVADSSTTGVKTIVRTTSADSTTVADSSLTRLLSAVRVPSTEVPAVSENVTRMTQAFRSPSSDSVTAVDSSTTRSATRVRAPSADTVTPSDSSLTRILSVSRAPNAETVTSSETSLTRLLQAFRSPSTDSVTTNENVTSQYTQGAAVIERAPSTENITVADSSLTRLLSALRLPSSDSISIGEQLTRILSAIRSPSSDSVVTADNATGVRSLSRATAADSITVLDSSLTRMLSALRLPSQDTITAADSSLTRMLSAIRIPSVEVISVGESLGSTLSGRVTRSASDTVIVDDTNLTRMLQAFRTVPQDTTNVNEQLTRSRTAVRLTTADTSVVSEAALARTVSLTRSVTSDTTAIIESALSRMLSAIRNLEDTISVSELVGIVGFTRSLEDTIVVTEPVLNRIVTAIRAVAPPESVNVSESVFFQTFHKFVFDSVTVAESLFKIRTSLSGSVTYATPDEVRPLLGNIGPTQRTDDQINLAIDAAYDEINTKTNRIPPDDWKDSDHNFGVIKKLARYIAAKEMAVGIKDFDTAALDTEIEHLWEILTYDTTSSATQNIVVTSQPETYASLREGIIWSTRYNNLKKNSSNENDTTINPDT